MKMRSSKDLFLNKELFTFGRCSEVGKMLHRLMRASGQSIFRFLVKRGIVPKRLKLVCVGGHFYEKKGSKWVEIK